MAAPDDVSIARPSDGALARWLDDHEHTQVWLARRLGISVATASRITRGATMPRPKLAHRIEEVTGGQVTVADLLRARLEPTPANRAARIQHAKDLITRGTSMLAAASEEV
jgi:DNA-binding transcriptional regulator YdaS (Cro superfamily)